MNQTFKADNVKPLQPVPMVMASTPRDRVETLRDRIQDSADIAAADRAPLLTFSDRLDLLAQQYSDHRHEKLLRHCTIMAEQLEDGVLAAALTDHEAAERIVGGRV